MRLKIGSIIERNVGQEPLKWFFEKIAAAKALPEVNALATAFAATSRKTGKSIVTVTSDDLTEIHKLRDGFTISGWSIDRLVRVWLIMHMPDTNQQQYVRQLENLFLTAEMNEQVALYASLPVLSFPDVWRSRCAEGIRSNIGFVLESIMCDNPYPAEYLDEAAWNQLVLKAIFTEKPVHRIVGLDERANQNLANTLSDYAHERWAAHRTLNPMLWRCVAPFVNDKIYPDIERIAVSENQLEREAAALVCQQSDFKAVKDLLKRHPELQEFLNTDLTWEKLAEKNESVSL